ncbi:uncharacterized protein LOC6585851 isoform X3 [Drosophila mojavensis]|uniref:Uncharacterized protein, isoform C n=1 Tax=Drosophila mojavensis TaxID=7230 RepID=A0A0Q9XS54_DROMO|nr:uncharacterized protein LOC6585851 isoform X3 [Drosophila mojavensis]KRG07377.1 uncharacterized protein Dmoj_GI14127, isoform C [Drosophila mojavensis]
MEPPGRLQPNREQQLVLCNPFITVETLPTSTTEHNIETQKQTQEHLVRISQYTKNPQPLISHQSFMQSSTKKSFATLTALTRSASTNANGERCSALSSSSATINTTALSGGSLGHNYAQHHPHMHHQQPTSPAAIGSYHQPNYTSDTGFSGSSQLPQQQTIEKLSRPMAFDKMEVLVREMQDQEHGVPVRQQKMFLTSIPYAFMGYDLIEWLMDHLQIEESEALNIANQLCLHGYFFPVSDSKSLTVKDDSSLYRFQTPYYWPWQHKAPDNVEYAIYLAKRSLRNKQRHALEDYEAEAFASLHKNLKGKWDFISMQAEEQVRLAKERKKGDKIVGDSQERAYWRVHRPPPGQFTPLEPCPIPSRDRQGQKHNKKKTVDDIQREVEFLSKTLSGTRMKMSQACESLVCYSETFSEYDFFLQPPLPSNPWVTEDVTFWQLNSTFVDIPTEKRVKRWAISIEELVSDPTGLQEFTNFLEREYSHENIRFWIAVNRLRRTAHSQVARTVNEIFEEFLKPGAPCEINIDGKTMESVLRGLKNPSRFTFDSASEHIYMLLLKKDCYPRFIRSDHYKRLIDSGIQPSHKKRFFNFGAVSGAKKKMTAALSNQPNLGDVIKSTTTGSTACGICTDTTAPSGNLARRRGSDRSLTGSALELAIIAVNKTTSSKVPHSHSQNNLCELPYRESPSIKFVQLETTGDVLPAPADKSICPWDESTLNLTSDVISISSNNGIIAVPYHRPYDDNAVQLSKQFTSSENETKRVSSSLTSSVPIVNLNLQSPKIRGACVDNNSGIIIAEDLLTISNAEGKSMSQNSDQPLSMSESLPRVSQARNINLLSKESEIIDLEASEHHLTSPTPTSQLENERNTRHSITTSTSTTNINRQLESELDVIKEVKIELIESSVYKNSNTLQELVSGPPINIFTKESDPKNNSHLINKEKLGSVNKINVCSEITVEEKIDYHIQENEVELSPTTDEYQEGMHFSNKDVVFDYDIIETERYLGCTAPAPTPAPSLAPLAVLEVDIVDDEPLDESAAAKTPTPVLNNDEVCRRRKKRNSATKKLSSFDERDKITEKPDIPALTYTDEAEHNAVCPWEDENVNTSDGTFVKTYATLGYL